MFQLRIAQDAIHKARQAISLADCTRPELLDLLRRDVALLQQLGRRGLVGCLQLFQLGMVLPLGLLLAVDEPQVKGSALLPEEQHVRPPRFARGGGQLRRQRLRRDQ